MIDISSDSEPPVDNDKGIIIKPKGRGPLVRNWCFTCNNFTEDQFEHFANAVKDGKCQFCGFGIEQADTGTNHLQGVI